LLLVLLFMFFVVLLVVVLMLLLVAVLTILMRVMPRRTLRHRNINIVHAHIVYGDVALRRGQRGGVTLTLANVDAVCAHIVVEGKGRPGRAFPHVCDVDVVHAPVIDGDVALRRGQRAMRTLTLANVDAGHAPIVVEGKVQWGTTFPPMDVFDVVHAPVVDGNVALWG